MDIDELIENFDVFDDWTDRYRYLIELGQSLPPMDDALKTAETKVKGCMSQVWLVGAPDAEDPRRLSFLADSDAHIVRGLIAIVLTLYSGKRADEILQTDAEPVLAELGLDKHLSPGRSNGLHAMIARVKDLARAVTNS